jgi:hypothetical protein
MSTSNHPTNDESNAPEKASVTIAARLKDLFNESPAPATDLFQNRKETLFKKIKNTLNEQPSPKQQLGGGPGIS